MGGHAPRLNDLDAAWKRLSLTITGAAAPAITAYVNDFSEGMDTIIASQKICGTGFPMMANTRSMNTWPNFTRRKILPARRRIQLARLNCRLLIPRC